MYYTLLLSIEKFLPLIKFKLIIKFANLFNYGILINLKVLNLFYSINDIQNESLSYFRFKL